MNLKPEYWKCSQQQNIFFFLFCKFEKENTLHILSQIVSTDIMTSPLLVSLSSLVMSLAYCGTVYGF